MCVVIKATTKVGLLMRILARLGVGREREVREGHYYDRCSFKTSLLVLKWKFNGTFTQRDPEHQQLHKAGCEEILVLTLESKVSFANIKLINR